jgi:hypothetical protein
MPPLPGSSIVRETINEALTTSIATMRRMHLLGHAFAPGDLRPDGEACAMVVREGGMSVRSGRLAESRLWQRSGPMLIENGWRAADPCEAKEGHPMPQYVITFPSDAMDHIPLDELPDVGRAAHAVCQDLIDAGVLLFSGGLEQEGASLVGTDGTVTDGPRPDFIGGITIVDVPSREDALQWAAKIAAACRCTQEVRAIGFDPELEAMLGKAVDADAPEDA